MGPGAERRQRAGHNRESAYGWTITERKSACRSQYLREMLGDLLGRRPWWSLPHLTDIEFAKCREPRFQFEI